MEGGIVEVVSPLLMQLAKVKQLALKPPKDGTIEQEFEVIERVIKDIKGIILGVKSWEGKLEDQFSAVVQHVDTMLESIHNGVVTEPQPTVVAGLREKCEELLKIQESLKCEITPPTMTTEPSSSLSQPPTPVYGKISDELQQLKLEELLQESPSMPYIKETIAMLDVHVKRCLFCIAVFPKNSIIKKRLLIYWWIGAELVNATRDKTAEENGEICFRELADRGLVQPIKRTHSAVADSCKMRSRIRKMVMAAAMKDLFFVGQGDPAEDASFEIVWNRSSQDKMSTLFNIDKQYLKVDMTSDDVRRNMAVMHMGRWQSNERHHIEVEDSEFLKGLGSSNKLRYLSLQGISRIMELPDSIGKLTNLVILDLRACHNLERLPGSIAFLKKLTHLDVSQCFLLDHMPRGLGSLSELQVLKGFVMANSRSKDPCRLSDLAKLDKLRKLSISIGRESIFAQEEFSKLSTFKALRSLTITWGLVKLEGDPGKITLSLPQGLNKLDIRCFPIADPPEWLHPDKLGSLKKLYVRGGKLARLDEIKGNNIPWKVEVLRLIYLNDFEYSKDFELEKEKLKEIFPELSYLEIRKGDGKDDIFEWGRTGEVEAAAGSRRGKEAMKDNSGPSSSMSTGA